MKIKSQINKEYKKKLELQLLKRREGLIIELNKNNSKERKRFLERIGYKLEYEERQLGKAEYEEKISVQST